jgi:hypothetical protein
MNVRQFRQLHQTVAPFVILPLSITILTGVTYRLAKSWFGLSRDQVHWLMTLHEGEYLGQFGEPIYVLLNGLGALWMLVTGSVMVWQNVSRWRQRINSAKRQTNPPDGDASDA